jgi:exosortase A
MSRLPDSLIASTRGWPLFAALTVTLMLLLIAVFWPTFHSMAEVWERSETFAHGFLIFPISAWLVWRMRDELRSIQPRTDLRGLILLAVAGVGWLLADAGSVNVAEQFAFVTMLIAAVWTLLGWNVFWAMFFPLMFLYFAIPVGEFLIQPLMGVTADFTVSMLQFVGIPVYREGTFFSIPSGDWSVVEGCSGLRYLIASITLGVLYAYLTYRSWQRRLLFSIAAMVVPVFANSGRAFMIVMIAHLSDMKLALGVDHYIYGWVFFGIVMLLLFWVGSFWREDGQPQSNQPDRRAPVFAAARDASTRSSWVAGILVLAVAGVWPAYARFLDSRALPVVAELQIEPHGGWQPAHAFTTWVPHWIGADRQLRLSFAQAGNPVLLELNYYVTQRQGAELINSQNFMVKQKDSAWSNIGEATAGVTIAGQTRQVRQARMRGTNGQRLLVWQWNLINQNPVVNDQIAKLILASDRVQLQRDDGLSVLIATPYEDGEMEAATSTLSRFAADMDASIGRALDRVDGQ